MMSNRGGGHVVHDQVQENSIGYEDQNPIGIDQEDEEDFEMKMPEQYHNERSENTTVKDQVVGNDGKIQRTYANGKKEVIFSNGVKRETFPDGYTIVYFNNSDIKQTFPDQKVVYYFAEARTTQTTFPDGLQVFKFSNNQVEKHFNDGTKEIM
jgi:centromere protein J